MEFLQPALLGALTILFAAALVLQQRSIRQMQVNAAESRAKLQEIVHSLVSGNAFLSKLTDAQAENTKTLATSADMSSKATSNTVECLVAHGKKIEVAISELEQRCKELSISSNRWSETYEEALRVTTREFRKESDQRTAALAETVSSIAEQHRQGVTKLQEKVVEDSLARDGRLADLTDVLQKQLSASLANFEKSVNAEESRRAAKVDEALSKLNAQVAGMSTSFDRLVKNLEEAVKF